MLSQALVFQCMDGPMDLNVAPSTDEEEEEKETAVEAMRRVIFTALSYLMFFLVA